MAELILILPLVGIAILFVLVCGILWRIFKKLK